MPNWTSNTLKIKGKREDLEKFERDMDAAAKLIEGDEGRVFTYQLTTPMPQEYKNTVSPRPLGEQEIRDLAKQYNWTDEALENRLLSAAPPKVLKVYEDLKNLHGYENWYDWACGNWGVKWDASGSEKSWTATMLVYTFESPWDAPREAIFRMAIKYPKLKFVLSYTHEGERGKETITFDGASLLLGC